MIDPYLGAWSWNQEALRTIIDPSRLLRKELIKRAKPRRKPAARLVRPHPVRTPAGLAQFHTQRYQPAARMSPGEVPPVTAPGPQPTDVEAQPETDAIAAAAAESSAMIAPSPGIPKLVWILGGAALLLGVAYAYSKKKPASATVKSNPRRHRRRGR